MRRILALFHRELTSVREAAFLLAMATIASNVLALVRDRLLASRFGAGMELDMYYAAFRVPDILYTLSLFFVASTAVIPLFLERVSESSERAHEFVQTILIAFLGSSIILVLVAYFTMPLLVPLLVPGFETDAQQAVVFLSRVLLISPILLGFSNLLSGILQSFRMFFVYAASFLFYNLGIILGILLFVPHWGLYGLAGGVILGALLHAGIQIPSIIHTGYAPRLKNLRLFTSRQQITDLLRVFYRSFPRTLGLAAAQGTFLIITAIASTLGAGSIAVFQLSYNLQSIPLAVIGLSYSVAAFPTMAELGIKKERAVFFGHLVSSARHIIFWTLPATVLFIVLRAQIVRVILGAGAFSWADTRLTAASLALFAIGIVAQSLVALFVRALYAIANTRVPVIINIISMVFTIILALFFVNLLQESEDVRQMFASALRVDSVPNIAVLGLPLAFAIGTVMNAVLIGFSLWKIGRGYYTRGLWVSMAEITGASILLGVVSYGVLQAMASIVDLNRFFGIFLQGFIAGMSGITAAVSVLYLLGNREFIEVRDIIHRRFWQKTTIGSEQEHL